MNGSPAQTGGISGTAGHSSALKMRASENAASALKQLADTEKQKENMKKTSDARIKASKSDGKKMSNKDWAAGNKKSGGTLNELVKLRGGLKKGTPEYNKVQNKINSALGSKKRYDEGPAVSETKVKPTKLQKATSKNVKVKAEADENLDKRTTKIAKNKARKDSGKDSKEFLEAKKANLEAKESDRQGSKGGKKQGFFRKLSSRINKNRQKKNQEKIDAKNETPAKKALVGNQKNLPEHLKAKIDAAPGKMYGKSMAKKYDK